uniref:Fork-head domain-containing protein n=1 Tax=Anopheles maculatus TaxID=74869 RepID=A0A182SQK9_9DIPT
EDAEVIPISEHHLTSTVLAPVASDVVHHTNGIVLTDISSSTWTSTAELLDLDPPTTSTANAEHVHTHRNNQDVNQQQQYSGGGGGGTTGGNSSPYNGTNNQSSANNWSNSGEPCRSTSDGSSPRRNETTSSATTTPVSALTNGMKTPERLASQTPDTPEDCKNLSWLLNFKLDDIPNLSPRSNRKQRSKAFAAGTGPGTANQEGTGAGSGGSGSLSGESGAVAIEEGDLNVGENVTIESSNGKSPKKPPFTYTELIEYALEEQGDLTVAAIYQWIS